MHLLAYGAGWPRLDLGAWWWRSVGFPVDEPVLALVDEILGSRRDELVAWLVTSPWSVDLSNVIADATGTTLPESGAPSVDRAWLADVERTSTDAGPYSSGGTDVLHLAIHTMSPIEDAGEPASRARWLVGAPSDRRAVLVVDQYAGWYRELARRAASLPPLPGDRSWRIDVVCSPVGHLGTYRRSRLTGRWFCTRHGVHQAGWGDG
jgi:hypothetical protein